MMKTTLDSREVRYIAIPERGIKSKTARTILEFRQLPVGWHYGDGGPISDWVCVLAWELNRYALSLGLSKTEAFPGVNGEVMVSVYPNGHVLDFTIYPEGTIRYRHEIDDEDVESEDNLSLADAKQKLIPFGTTSWNLSDLPTPSISVRNKASTKTSRSQTVNSEEESPLLTMTVLWKPVPHFAST
jgi:hypothetical protein